ncbi:MAG: hypothetical protein Q9227_007100 [Pyrenula ochraceoflavens]
MSSNPVFPPRKSSKAYGLGSAVDLSTLTEDEVRVASRRFSSDHSKAKELTSLQIASLKLPRTPETMKDEDSKDAEENTIAAAHSNSDNLRNFSFPQFGSSASVSSWTSSQPLLRSHAAAFTPSPSQLDLNTPARSRASSRHWPIKPAPSLTPSSSQLDLNLTPTRPRAPSQTQPFPSLGPSPSQLDLRTPARSRAPSRTATPDSAFRPEVHAARAAALATFRYCVNTGRPVPIRENQETLLNYLKSYDWNVQEAAANYDQRIARIRTSRATREENDAFRQRWAALEGGGETKSLMDRSMEVRTQESEGDNVKARCNEGSNAQNGRQKDAVRRRKSDDAGVQETALIDVERAVGRSFEEAARQMHLRKSASTSTALRGSVHDSIDGGSGRIVSTASWV